MASTTQLRHFTQTSTKTLLQKTDLQKLLDIALKNVTVSIVWFHMHSAHKQQQQQQPHIPVVRYKQKGYQRPDGDTPSPLTCTPIVCSTRSMAPPRPTWRYLCNWVTSSSSSSLLSSSSSWLQIWCMSARNSPANKLQTLCMSLKWNASFRLKYHFVKHLKMILQIIDAAKETFILLVMYYEISPKNKK